ncbi:DoxX family protein [Moraxella nasibovis]|uniref:DoxX family protein n=1 Tax=Moraxella nasibovis TaxID=2904120 RepID=UPI0024103027|nr:DoxX family protein [Moraxella nasibovis]WFF38685.1 DoxX family protein [Moraxella nasibovis]
MNTSKFDILAPIVLSILRIVTGYAFFLHGTAKAFGFPVDNTAYLGGNWFSLMGMATILELVGGILIMVGFLTRPTAFILSGQMAAAYFMMHASIFPLANGGEPAMLFSFIFLYLAVAGGGSLSLDNLFNKKVMGELKK